MKTLKKLSLSFLIIGLLAITGCNQAPGDEKPEVVLQKMQTVMQEEKEANKKGTSNGSISGEIKGPDFNMKLNADIKSTYDTTDATNPMLDLETSVKGSGSSDEFTGDINVDLAAKVLEKMLYIKLNDLDISSKDDPSLGEELKLMTAFIGKKWFKLPLPEENNLILNPLSTEKLTANGELTKEQIEAIEELVKEIPMLQYIEDAGSNAKEYRYKVTLHRDNVVRFINEVSKILGEDPAGDEINIILAALDAEAVVHIDAETYKLNEIKNGSLKVMDPDEEGTLEMEFSGTLSERKSKVDATMKVESPIDGTIEINITANMDTNAGADISIEVPEDAQEFDPLMMMGLGGGLPETIPHGNDQMMMDEESMMEMMESL